MSEYAVYVKRTEPWTNYQGRTFEPDKCFRAIDGNGKRVTKLVNAMTFATKEDAVEWVEYKASKSVKGKIDPIWQWEVRKVK